MRFHRPDTLTQARALLAADEDARCLAGGATLVAMLNADLVRPSALVSLSRIAELQGIGETADGITIGAMTRHRVVAADERLSGGLAVVRSAAGHIGHPAIRAVGTIGGSLAHADPAADHPTALLAAAARIEIAGTNGRRTLTCDEFFVDYYTTALSPGEMIVAVHLPPPPPQAVSSYRKVARSDGDFATASLAFVGTFDDRVITNARVAVGGCAATPVHSDEADALLRGLSVGDPRIAHAAECLIAACDPIDDVRGSADYRRTLIKRLLPRVLDAARTGEQRE